MSLGLMRFKCAATSGQTMVLSIPPRPFDLDLFSVYSKAFSDTYRKSVSLRIVDNISSESQGNCALRVNVAPGIGQTTLSNFKGRVSFVTLGCAKNRVDSEVMIGSLEQNGFEIVPETANADIIVINTCGFLESSVKESIDTIVELAELKEKGRCRKIIVAGCMVKRYGEELKASLPEVDHFISVDEILDVAQLASDKTIQSLQQASRPYFLYDDTLPRRISTPGHTAYVKISEGCNRPCTFCIIPKIRGSMRSRSVESVVKEVRDLGNLGVREINLVAQDLTAFGSDSGRPNLSTLLKRLNDENAVQWIRLLYAYPVGVDETLLRSIVDLPSVLEYLDIPLQHSSLPVLEAMKRPLGKFSPRKIVEFIRTTAPSISIRTTFIVGFPGETEKDIDDLENFIREGHFSNVGIFKYSKEKGTPSFEMSGHVSEKVKEDRYQRLMFAQQEVAFARNESLIGSEIEIILDGKHPETDLLLSGRARFQAPEVDGTVIINDFDEGLDPADLRPGHIGKLMVTETAGYDLVGKIVSCYNI